MYLMKIKALIHYKNHHRVHVAITATVLKLTQIMGHIRQGNTLNNEMITKNLGTDNG